MTYKSPETGVEYRSDIDGLAFRWTSRGICVMEIDYWADPEKTPEWAEKQRRLYTLRQWKREMLRDWTTAEGDAFFPEFTINPDLYQLKIPCLSPGPVIRGWDFGFRGPACVWMQVLPNGRVLVLRELLALHTEIHEFRDLVMYLSGQRELEQLQKDGRKRALHFVDMIVNKRKAPWKSYPKPPWFGGVTKWLDFAGHEANATSGIQTMHNDKPETCAKDVLIAGGIQLQAGAVRKAAREYVFRRLLGQLEDGLPGIIIDPRCKLLVEGFNGGLAYPKPTKLNPQPTEILRDGVYEHLYDAGGYGVANVVDVTEARDVKPKIQVWVGRELKTLEEEEYEKVESYSTSRDVWSRRPRPM